AGGVDTCFALLFLKRANLAEDLTAKLKGRIQDPAIVALKSGGVGADKLIAFGKGMKSGIEGKTKPGEKTTGPKKVIPDTKPLSLTPEDKEIAQMSIELAKAETAKQEELLASFRDSKGSKYTAAIAGAIPLLKGSPRTKARDALANRLTRMTVKTLRYQMEDD